MISVTMKEKINIPVKKNSNGTTVAMLIYSSIHTVDVFNRKWYAKSSQVVWE